MNLRILKKLSKRAAPLLPLLGDRREQFPADREGSTGILIMARKHFERMRVRNDRPPAGQGEIKVAARNGDGWIWMAPPSAPRKGTIMVGAVGYYDREWNDQTAWEALTDLVYASFTDWGTDPPSPLRRVRSPSDVLRAANDLLAERERAAI